MHFIKLPFFLTSLIIIVYMGVSVTAHSQNITHIADDADQTNRAAKLDNFFSKLKREKDPNEAKKISNKIWTAWNQWDDDAIDLLMSRAGQAMDAGNLTTALDILDQAIVLAPQYAEAWNRRATVYYLSNNFSASIADIEQTLALEPRHFGALMGLAQIMQALGENKRAVTALQEVLNVYPAMEAPQSALVKLLETTEEQDL